MLAPCCRPVPERGGLRPAGGTSNHHLEGLSPSRVAGRLQRQSCSYLDRQHMIDQKLQAALALVLIHIEAIHQLHRALGGTKLPGSSI